METLWAVVDSHGVTLKTLFRKINELSNKFDTLGVDTNKNRQKMGNVLGTLPKVIPSSDRFMQTRTKFKILLENSTTMMSLMQTTSTILMALGMVANSN